jgi:hypothetical protein
MAEPLNTRRMKDIKRKKIEYFSIINTSWHVYVPKRETMTKEAGF